MDTVTRGAKVAQGGHLRVAWSTLYAITKGDDDVLGQALEARQIRADMTRADVRRLAMEAEAVNLRAENAAARALALLLVGCSSSTGVCTAIFAYGITVDVIDTATQQSIAGRVTGVLTDGAYTEVMMSIGGEFLVGAGERQGTYRVEITREGFTSFVQSNVEVGHDGCHVVGVTLRAELTRIP